jgi:hypothetical protein
LVAIIRRKGEINVKKEKNLPGEKFKGLYGLDFS